MSLTQDSADPSYLSVPLKNLDTDLPAPLLLLHLDPRPPWPCGQWRVQRQQHTAAPAARPPTCTHPPVAAPAGPYQTLPPAKVIVMGVRVVVVQVAAMVTPHLRPCCAGHC